MSESLPHKHTWAQGKFHKYCMGEDCLTIKNSKTGILENISYEQWVENVNEIPRL